MCSGEVVQASRRRIVLAALVALAMLTLATPAWAGQIVYTHGNDLWVMNDNGTGQRPLVTAAQVGGQIGFLPGGGDLGVGVEPNGTGVAFDAAVAPAGATCGNSANCPGLYSLLNGKLLRLSNTPAACSTATMYCGGEDIEPAVTSTGQVVYYSLFVTSSPACGLYYCGINGNSVQEYNYRALDGSTAPAVWPLPAESGANTNDALGADPEFNGALASDPADPTKIAYTGNYVGGGVMCNGGDCFPLTVENSAGAYSQTGLDDALYDGLAFSQNGSLVADIESGDNRGIWVYPSSQSYKATNPTYTWALADPDNGSTGNPYDRVIDGLTFVGNSELVFSANYNLWSIPTSCWTPAQQPTSTPAAKCGTFPNGATQLTHDGNVATPDGEPAWTASTTPIQAYSTTPCCSPPPPTGNQISALKLASSSVKSGKSLTIDVTLKSATTITITIESFVPGKHHKKGRYKALGRLVFAGKAGLNAIKFTKVGGHTLKASKYKYEAVVVAGGAPHTLTFKVHH